MDQRESTGLDALNDPGRTAEYLGVPVQTLAAWRHQKTGIPFVRIGRLIRYRREDILQYVTNNLQEVA